MTDGDTFKAKIQGAVMIFRMADIDAPEKDQPYGREAREVLKAALDGKDVVMLRVDTDNHGRLVVHVWIAKLHINREVVAQGAAWFYPEYAHDDCLFEVENEARDAKRGLWKLPPEKRVEPWVWRERKRDAGGAQQQKKSAPNRQRRDREPGQLHVKLASWRRRAGRSVAPSSIHDNSRPFNALPKPANDLCGQFSSHPAASRRRVNKETDMNSKIKGSMLAVVALVMSCGAAAGDGRKGRDYTAQLQGAWTSQVTVRHCVTGDVLIGPFAGLSTFHQGGTQSETAAGTPTVRRGPSHGFWYRTGKHTFFNKFVFQRFDLNGFLIGTQEVRSTQEVAEGSMHASAVATIVLKDVNGVQVGTGCATAELDRMQ